MNMDFGVSKAFGLPIELMEIPKTPDAFHRDLEDLLGQGFGPQGKHKLGMQSHYAGKAYGDKYVPVTLSLEAGLARGMIEEHASTSIISGGAASLNCQPQLVDDFQSS
jgi:hypothetical protein